MRRLLRVVLLLTLTLASTGCWLVPGSQQRAIRNGIDKAQPAVDAIEAYHTKYGNYPRNLQALAPRYSTAISTSPNSAGTHQGEATHDPPVHYQVASINDLEFDYKTDGTWFTLRFSYPGFCLNFHTYDSRTRTWEDSGRC